MCSDMQHFPANMIENCLCPDISSCLVRDFHTGEYHSCKIMKSNRKYVDMYLGKGWYSYAKGKNLRWEIRLHAPTIQIRKSYL